MGRVLKVSRERGDWGGGWVMIGLILFGAVRVGLAGWIAGWHYATNPVAFTNTFDDFTSI